MRTRTIFSQTQTGRSIVELMIAVTIGMVILISISSLFYANKKTLRATDDKSRLDEEGRLALHLLSFHVRMAGYGTLLSSIEKSEDDSTVPVKVQPAVYTSFADNKGASTDAIRGCAGGFADSAKTLADLTCTGPGATPDAFLVRYVVDEFSDNTTAAGVPTDCLGAAVLPTAIPPDAAKKKGGILQEYIVENRFYIKTTNGIPELYCRGNGGLANPTDALNEGQPIAENVENMQLSYGVSFNGTQTIDRYLTADKLSATDWQRVIAVRICLVVRSASDNVATTKQTYVGCDGSTKVTPNDKRLRSVFNTTVTIRSRAVGAA